MAGLERLLDNLFLDVKATMSDASNTNFMRCNHPFSFYYTVLNTNNICPGHLGKYLTNMRFEKYCPSPEEAITKVKTYPHKKVKSL